MCKHAEKRACHVTLTPLEYSAVPTEAPDYRGVRRACSARNNTDTVLAGPGLVRIRRERRRVLIYSGAVKSVNTCDHRKVHLNVYILICGGRIGLQYEPGALLGPLGGIL